MDLWIRSQNKNYLMRAGVLALRDIKGTIISNTVSDTCYIIGEYKTKERALEVLDEIQNVLKPKGFISFNEVPTPEMVEEAKKEFDKNFVVAGAKVDLVKVPETYVYKMPKE